MIAGARIDPLAADVLAALCAQRPVAAPLTPALRALLPAEVAADGVVRALARRRAPQGTPGHPTAAGAAPAARFLRRLGRRARTLHGPPLVVPDAATLAQLAARVPHAERPGLNDDRTLGAWVFVWSHADAGRRRDAAAALPFELGRAVGHAPPPPPALVAGWRDA